MNDTAGANIFPLNFDECGVVFSFNIFPIIPERVPSSFLTGMGL
jgi:hypothetical protein